MSQSPSAAASSASGPSSAAGSLPPAPISRAGTPADLRDAYLYLASEGASYVTGETVWVDGGASL